MSKMKPYKITSYILCAILVMLSFASCIHPWTWRYDKETGIFKTQDGSMTVDFYYQDALLLVDGEYLELGFGISPTLLKLSFDNHISSDGKNPDKTIHLYVDVEADQKTKTLTLTVTGGSLEQYIGNVYVLNFYPGEELNLDAETTQETAEDE